MLLRANSTPTQAPPLYQYAGEEKMKMSTQIEKPITVDNFRPRGRPKTYKKRELPIELIKQLHSQGSGSKAISSTLKAEQGIKVSYKTIQRILSGERI
jgi:transposase